jgi:NAD(P)-dependent dehydrogenase (short-subunit alcohol dehydrogenase family)
VQPRDRPLEGRVGLVTGASRGIGVAMARCLADAGASVVLMARDAERLRALEVEISAGGGTALAWSGDVGDGADAHAAVAAAVDAFGRLDFLVNNAGTNQPFGLIEDVPEDVFDDVMRVAFKGTWLMARAAVGAMKAAGNGGAIINVSSIYGLVGAPQQSVYCSAKGAVVQLTRSLAIECAQQGIRINCVCPGYTTTETAQGWFDAQPDPAHQLEAFLQTIPQNRAVSPEEVAELTLFLVSDASASITGQMVPIDGGFTAQ